MADNRFSEEQTKFILDKYKEHIPNVGPMKKFRTKKLMWEQIKDEMESDHGKF